MFDDNPSGWTTAFITFLLLCVTAIYVWATLKIQSATEKQAVIQANALELQNRLFNAQLLAQRHDLFWRTHAPITDEEVAEVELVPDDYMSPELFEKKYKSDQKALRRYLYLSRLYLYLAFTHSMKKLGLPDPMGDQWTKLWTESLARHPEFLEVNDWYKAYYPEFSVFVSAINKPETNAAQPSAAPDDPSVAPSVAPVS